MFVQATTCKHGKTTYLTYLVRESFRTSKGPRSRTICNITALPPQTRELISQSLRGQSFVAGESLQLAEAWSFGGLAVLHQGWEDFGLGTIFSFVANARTAGLLKAMTLGRILFPSAKLALVDHARGTLLAAACGLDQASEDFDEDDLYAAMDELNGQWVGIEKQLYHQSFPEGVSLVLYDLTSVYFEGDGPEGTSQYGHSRDHRSDRPQVLLAVATDARGVPLHLEVLRGNRGDTTTLQGLLATLRRRFGIREAVFVFDGGMSSKVNLEAMDELGLQYVTRLCASTLDELLASLPPEPSPELWDRAHVMEIVREGKRYVVAGGCWRQQRDEQRRQARLTKAENELKRLAAVKRKRVNPQKLASQVGRALQRLKAHKYFEYAVDTNGHLQWSRRAEVIQAEHIRDGLYLLGTNAGTEQIPSAGVLTHYKNLLEVEDAFCHLKDYLRVRPVFHRRPDRVRNHVRICFLAYWLTAKLERQWRQQDQTIEVHNLLRQLQTIRLGRLEVQGKPFKTLVTRVPRDLNATLSKLGLLPLFSQPPTWAPEACSK
ncbi:MAG TPA: IS1634 family transposase [Alphaproteobacteria bacterium]|nr:IS1634 family transposase [Alphaproteobacteria bacterium]